MNAERWEQYKHIFEVLDESGGDPNRVLAELTSGDDALRREIEWLLAHQSNNGHDFLELPALKLSVQTLGADFKWRIFDPGERIGARWRIDELLGMGGMGEVYRAFDYELDESVALKTLRRGIAGFDSSAAVRFRAEIRTARRIGHPHVCKVYDLFTHLAPDGKEIRFVTMELAAGETLAARLNREGAMPHDKALELARQMIEGLSAAHKQNVIHGDFKTANVMLTSVDAKDHVLLLDFGLARTLLQSHGVASEYPSSAVMGQFEAPLLRGQMIAGCKK